MIAPKFYCVVLLCLISLAGCNGVPLQPGSNQSLGTTIPEEILSTLVPGTPVAEETINPEAPLQTEVVTQTAAGATLRIWLPPEFDPAGNSSANKLLKARLEEFETQNPGVDLEVRVKALDGPGGLLDGLATANAAAPLALPDLVLLPRALLESAALKGYLHPFDGLSSIGEDSNWFDYARQLAQLKDSTYGMPFAGDAMLVAYRPSMIGGIPNSLEDTISSGEVALFPAADPQALFTINTYLATGESLQDEEGRPWVDKETLLNILEIYQNASQGGVMPYWLTQYSNDEQVWDDFTSGQFPLAVSWASSYMEHQSAVPSDLSLAPVPTLDGTPYSLATGWSWALAGQDPDRREISARLAEFLVEKEFLSAWTYAAGYLPPRVDALQGWPEADLRRVFERISYSAQLMPPADLISSTGLTVEQAVVDVLKAQSDPQSAAQAAVEKINQP